MRIKIFNKTKTITIDDALVERVNRHQSKPIDENYIEFELATKDIDANTNLTTKELNTTVEKLLTESAEVFEHAGELHTKAHTIVK